jgi:glycerate 2-kinase
MKTIREDLGRIMSAALDAVDPRVCVQKAVRRDGDRLVLAEKALDLPRDGRLVVLGAGKAAAGMAAGLETALGDRIDEGLVIATDGGAARCERIRIEKAGHPLPDERGLDAARRLAAVAERASAEDLVLVVLSGGGSALLTLPAGDLSLDDLVRTDRLLLRSGMGIGEMNAVRKHLSALKGGQLALRIRPARSAVLVLSDVPGDSLPVIASGPTVADPTTFGQAVDILMRFGLWKRVPKNVRVHLSGGVQATRPETPKPGDPRLDGIVHRIVGSGRTAALAALREGRRLGYGGLLLTATLQGEARVVGGVIASLARELVASGHPIAPPALLVAAGETTVTVQGSGRGGRNQELALSAAAGIDGMANVAVASLGTDGQDGPTDAAGGLVNGETARALAQHGIDFRAALRRNDAYPALEAVDGLIRTGPTGTNVSDLVFVLAGIPSSTASGKAPS